MRRLFFPKAPSRFVRFTGLGLVLGGPFAAALVTSAGCVPPGNSTPTDAGPSHAETPTTPAFRPSPHTMTTPFEDTFDRAPATVRGLAPHSHLPPVATDAAKDAKEDAKDKGVAEAEDARAADGEAQGPALGPDWTQAGTNVWHIENGWLCGQGAHNHGVWLNKVLPVNARIEFDAKSDAQDGDLKAELWGDGHSAATAISYTNATSYLTILGGWHNKFHVLARINEHGNDRKEIHVDPESDDPREKPVVRGQIYHFKVERLDGKTVKWAINGVEMLQYDDDAPLAGAGHDHFGFNDWENKVCFDNVRITPISSL